MFWASMLPVKSNKPWIRILANFRVFSILRFLTASVRALSYIVHKIQFQIEWRTGNNPEHFDHQIDVHYLWKKTRNSYPLERGVISSLALLSNVSEGDTLDLCCGDGFFSYYFYVAKSRKVVAVDFDPLAISSAKRNYKDDKIEWYLMDIRKEFPEGSFQNIIWDAAIEHFTEDEITRIMLSVKNALEPNGVLSGYTIQERVNGKTHLHQHEYEFKNKEDLGRFFLPHFKNVQIIETRYKDRTNYYFMATDGILPLLNENTVFNILEPTH